MMLNEKDVYEVLKHIAEQYPEQDFHYHLYCHDGYWHDFDFAFKNGEYVEWNDEEHSIYDGLEDEEEFD